jgi:hypothetical protein
MLELDRLCDDERDVPLGDGGPPFVRAADAVYDSGQRQAARTVGRSSVVRIYPLRGGTARGLPYGTPSGAESDMVYERWGENGAVTRSTQRAIERILIQRARVKG